MDSDALSEKRFFVAPHFLFDENEKEMHKMTVVPGKSALSTKRDFLPTNSCPKGYTVASSRLIFALAFPGLIGSIADLRCHAFSQKGKQ